MNSISIIVVELFKLSIPKCVSCDSLCFFRNVSISSNVKFICVKLFLVCSYYHFHGYRACSDSPCFTNVIGNLFLFCYFFGQSC